MPIASTIRSIFDNDSVAQLVVSVIASEPVMASGVHEAYLSDCPLENRGMARAGAALQAFVGGSIEDLSGDEAKMVLKMLLETCAAAGDAYLASKE
jgi:hypothetical protein